jgi:DDE superfamily endonuclease
VAAAVAGKAIALGTPIEIWFEDEMRVGQKNGLVYQWAQKGTRPRQPKDQRYANAYVFGAICPARDTGSALVLPRADATAMQLHLDQISGCVANGAHAVLTLDKAGWHTTRKLQVPSNITLLHLPPASPELNPTENIWQYMRQNYLSNRVFRDYDDVVEASSSAWNKLTAEQGRIASIGKRSWTEIGQGP